MLLLTFYHVRSFGDAETRHVAQGIHITRRNEGPVSSHQRLEYERYGIHCSGHREGGVRHPTSKRHLQKPAVQHLLWLRPIAQRQPRENCWLEAFHPPPQLSSVRHPIQVFVFPHARNGRYTHVGLVGRTRRVSEPTPPGCINLLFQGKPNATTTAFCTAVVHVLLRAGA